MAKAADTQANPPRASRLAAFVVLMLAASTAPAGAEWFITPFIGLKFAGDTNFPDLEQGASNTKMTLGASAGVVGDGLFGVETEFGYSPRFFERSSGSLIARSNVLTLMGNVMLAPKFGPVQPYGLGGIGLIKSSVDLTLSGIVNEDNNQFGWDAGGGLMIFFGSHFGIRGDVRYYHSFQALQFLGLPIPSDAKLDFGRAAGGVVFKF